MVWNVFRHYETFRRGSRVWRTDRQTDGMAFSNSNDLTYKRTNMQAVAGSKHRDMTYLSFRIAASDVTFHSSPVPWQWVSPEIYYLSNHSARLSSLRLLINCNVIDWRHMHVATRRTIDRSIHLPSIEFSIDDESSAWPTSVLSNDIKLLCVHHIHVISLLVSKFNFISTFVEVFFDTKH